MDVGLVASLVVAIAIAAGAFQAGRLRERVNLDATFAKIVDDRLGVLRTDVAELHDRFDHWTKRERRRAYVEKTETENPSENGSRRERVAALQGEIMRRRRGIL